MIGLAEWESGFLFRNRWLFSAEYATGEEMGVLREISKDVSGPKKRFVRFSVDRNKLLRSKRELTGDQRIDNFWSSVREKFGM
jgi:hypothetical protein